MTFPNRSGPVSPTVGNMIPRAWESCSQAAGNVEDMSWRTGYRAMPCPLYPSDAADDKAR